MKKSTLVIVGTVVGVGVATTTVLRSKKSKEMKKHLLKKVNKLHGRLADIEDSEIKQILLTNLEEVNKAIESFDWETSKKGANNTYFELKENLKLIKVHIEAARVNEAPKVGEVKIDLVIETESN